MGWVPNPGTDDDAIHDNVSGEIQAVTEKTVPVDADIVLIEDSAASYAKKRVQLGNLPGGSGGTFDDLTDVDVTGAAEGDMVFQDSAGDWILVTGSKDDGDVPTIQADGTVAWEAPPSGTGTRIGELALTTPPTSGWSWINQGSATETVSSEGSIILVTPAVGSANLVGRVRSHSASSTITGRFNDRPIGNANSAVGLWMRESSTSKLVVFYIKPNGDVLIENWTNATTFSASGASQAHGVGWRPIWLRIEDNSTNLIFSTSYTGFPDTWFQLSSVSRTAFLAGGPDETGWLLRDNSAAKSGILSSWTQA
jgi:hypothetical protein